MRNTDWSRDDDRDTRGRDYSDRGDGDWRGASRRAGDHGRENAGPRDTWGGARDTQSSFGPRGTYGPPGSSGDQGNTGYGNQGQSSFGAGHGAQGGQSNFGGQGQWSGPTGYGPTGSFGDQAGSGSQEAFGGRGTFGSQGTGLQGGSGTQWGGERGFTDSGRSGSQNRRGQFSGKGPKGYQRSDERIREDICDRLTEDGTIDASEIEVTVTHGEVTLTGTVSERRAKRYAEELSEDATGVKDVHNTLRVKKTEDTSSSSSNRDTDTTSRSKSSSRSGDTIESSSRSR